MKVKIMCDIKNLDKIKSELKSGNVEFVNSGEELVITDSNYKRNHLLGQKNGDFVIIKPEDIIYIESYGNDVLCHTVNDEFQVNDRLYEVEAFLHEYGFLRVHKSYVINTNSIVKISPSFDRKFILTMKCGTKIDVSRSYFYKFKEHIGM